MAYNFYVLEGKKLIDYRPKSEHYKRAIVRMIQDDIYCLEDSDKMKKYIFLNVKKLLLKDMIRRNIPMNNSTTDCNSYLI